ncbi:MAG: copper chaperone PCu(A)C [Alphaproteobacteria bacterium]|nr:copper chaperone PCu(A)C [Alphaproteobacteria bacterium]MBT5654713.1 copper chaperone PCu(A)C [Alphaproteobacteria bacterium]
MCKKIQLSILFCLIVCVSHTPTFLCAKMLLPQSTNFKNIHISGPFSRATTGKNGAIFMDLKNAGSSNDKLVGVACPLARSVELHNTVKEGKVMKMRTVESIDLPIKTSASLAPGGKHIMLMGLYNPLKEGENLTLTLFFERAGQITLEIPIAQAGAKSAPLQLPETKDVKKT